MAYKHGIYGELIASQEQLNSPAVGTIPIYIGTAPVHRLSDYSKSINNPILISGLEDAKSKLGYNSNDDFDSFTLSGAVYAHFENKIQVTAPIVVINVFNPAVHKSTANANVTLINGKGYINDQAVLGTIAIEGKTKGTDYTVSYDTNGKAMISSISNGIESPVAVSYDKVNTSAIQSSDVVGEYNEDTGKRTGISCVEIVYEKLNIIPSIISAPGFNHEKIVHDSLVDSCSKISGRWEATIVTDIDPNLATSINDALEWKKEFGYDKLIEKVCWPKVKSGNKVLWMSILTIVRIQQTDLSNSNIPSETASNKPIDITGLVLGDNSEYIANQTQANLLNEKGITTALYFGGRWVLWGPHMANYEYGVTTKPEEIFDVNIRTNLYLINDFNNRNAALVDAPIQRNDIDYLLSNEQLRLNSLISDGKLLYGTISFNASSQNQDLVNGDFAFDTKVTNTPPGKSITNKVQYTSTGLSKLVGGES